MTVRRLALVVSLLATAAPAHLAQQRFRTITDGVRIDVLVTDGRRPIAGLQEKDFILLDQGVRQDIDTIAIEDIPSDEDLTSSKPPLSPMILGVFRGTPVGERSVFNPYDHFPASIVLYQRNLERFAKTREELIEQIGITLMHEVGHLIGLDEEDLWERGLE